MGQDNLLPRRDQTARVAKFRFSFRRIASRDPHSVAGYKRKTPPAEPEALLKKYSNDREAKRSLRLCGGRLRRGWFWRGRLCRRGRSGLNRVSLIVQPDNVLSNIDLRRSEENRSVLRGGIQDDDVPVFAGIAVEHVHHLAADSVDDVGLLGLNVFLILRVHAIAALGEPLTLLPEAGFFFRAQLATAAGKTLLQITDLLVEIFDFVLPRSELRLQLGGSELSLRGRNDGLANADDADLAGCVRARRVR